AFAAYMPLTRRSRSPQHSFNAGKNLHFALIGFVSNLKYIFFKYISYLSFSDCRLNKKTEWPI
ncbi:hypothetical protein, partial [Dickeya dadantii]|uniref:hypothetical protein n=1 Tax=Dickeya dadantii TaxID=204038 RepID=UPI001C12F595